MGGGVVVGAVGRGAGVDRRGRRGVEWVEGEGLEE